MTIDASKVTYAVVGGAAGESAVKITYAVVGGPSGIASAKVTYSLVAGPSGLAVPKITYAVVTYPVEPVLGGRRRRPVEEAEEPARRRRTLDVPVAVSAPDLLRRRPGVLFEDLAEAEPFARRRSFGLAPLPSRVRPWFQIFTS